MYENKTRLELMEELAALEDHFETKVSDEVRKRCADFEKRLTDFFTKFETGSIEDARSNLGMCAEYAFQHPTSKLGMLRGLQQWMVAYYNDWPQKYVNYDGTGIADKLLKKLKRTRESDNA